jgi:hypothetical protein
VPPEGSKAFSKGAFWGVGEYFICKPQHYGRKNNILGRLQALIVEMKLKTANKRIG